MENEKELEQAKKEIEQHLEEKYKERFQVLSCQISVLPVEYDQYCAVREGSNAKTDCFTVKRYRNQHEADRIFEDEYFSLLIREDMENAVSILPALKGVERKVYIKQVFFSKFCNDFESDDTLETAKAAGALLDADYYIFLRGSDLEMTDQKDFVNRTEALFTQMNEILQPGLVRVCALKDQAFSEICRENCASYLSDYYHADGEDCIVLVRRVIKANE